ncbi:MAG: hypothetical protein Edafosvirus9_32 [Edafosvirus sp.]|uniref:Uncharacterized protein n=1 Tax=Edafosvirus sp. TaxID=2487765 RepID=A0A3G4ZTU7_9VIRU|nr:MAG: hypothetical protein Edafosvirus9_32 [Edafosvirus sp.]
MGKNTDNKLIKEYLSTMYHGFDFNKEGIVKIVDDIIKKKIIPGDPSQIMKILDKYLRFSKVKGLFYFNTRLNDKKKKKGRKKVGPT